MEMATMALAAVAVCAFLNRVRGGGFGGNLLPGRPLFWVTPIIGLIAWAFMPWKAAAAFACGYMLWALFSWGHIIAALGGFKPLRSPSTLEAALMAPGSKVFAAFARMMFIAPGLMAVAYLIHQPAYLIMAPIFAAFACIIYAYRLPSADEAAWQEAEILTGALIGALIVIAGAIAR